MLLMYSFNLSPERLVWFICLCVLRKEGIILPFCLSRISLIRGFAEIAKGKSNVQGNLSEKKIDKPSSYFCPCLRHRIPSWIESRIVPRVSTLRARSHWGPRAAEQHTLTWVLWFKCWPARNCQRNRSTQTCDAVINGVANQVTLSPPLMFHVVT